MNNTKEETQLVDRLTSFGAMAPEAIEIPGGTPVVSLPATHHLESLAKFYPPQRIERSVTLLEAGSFADYVNRFKMPDTLIFVTVSETGCTFRAMLDYHSPAPELKPAFCQHEAVFTAVETPDWKTWKAADRKKLKQVEFAEWLEDNARLFVDPPGADLLELVTNLHGHANARFNQAARLKTGAQSVSFEEDVIIKGGSSTTSDSIELPATVSAGIAVFQGSEKYEVKARLKCGIEERRLVLRFETIALAEIVRESILLLVGQISEKTGLVPLIGTP